MRSLRWTPVAAMLLMGCAEAPTAPPAPGIDGRRAGYYGDAPSSSTPMQECARPVTDTLFVPLPDGSVGYVIEYLCAKWLPRYP